MMDEGNETVTTQAPPPEHGKVSAVKPHYEISLGSPTRIDPHLCAKLLGPVNV